MLYNLKFKYCPGSMFYRAHQFERHELELLVGRIDKWLRSRRCNPRNCRRRREARCPCRSALRPCRPLCRGQRSHRRRIGRQGPFWRPLCRPGWQRSRRAQSRPRTLSRSSPPSHRQPWLVLLHGSGPSDHRLAWNSHRVRFRYL